MGCGGSKSQPAKDKDDLPEIDPIDVPDMDPDGPPPAPPDDMKDDIFKAEDFKNIDTKAQQMSRTRPASYEDLTRALATHCKTDMEKARALFVWLFHQDVYGSWYHGVTDPHTPAGYMKLIKQGMGNYASFYAILCREAGIPCHVLRGVAKGATYEVGQEDSSNMEGAWCALYLDGGWRLVHPMWAYFQDKAVFENGQAPRPSTKRPTIQEFFWLCDPTKMICFCKPRMEPWQLLKSKWDQKKFMRSPRLTEDYFTSKLMLPKKYNAIINTDTGVCVIEFDHRDYDEVVLKAEAYFVEDMSSDRMPSDAEMRDYVVTSSGPSSKTAIVRCPVKGRYILEVYGRCAPAATTTSNNTSKNNNQNRKPQQQQQQQQQKGQDVLPKIVEFRLECSDCGKDPQPFPTNPEDGFGLLPKASMYGISEIDPPSGLVLVKPGQRKTFTVTSSQKVSIAGSLVHNELNPRDLEDYVSVSQPGSTVVIEVTVPKGKHLEFGLEIQAKPDGSNQSYSPVANYLLVDENWLKKTAVVSPRKVGSDDEKIRKRMIVATQEEDIAKLEKSIVDFENQGLADNGDLTRARKKLVELHLENLRVTTKARKLDPLEKAIDDAKKSCVADHIIYTKQMTDAEAARRQLKRLRLYMHKVMELNKATISEIHSYKRPRPLVHKVMKATFRILGEPNKKLESWPYIQNNMRRLGRQSMISRMRNLDIVQVQEPQINDAEKHMGTTNKLLVRLSSAGAGTFYVWSNNMINEYQGKGATEPQNIWSRPGKKNNNPWTSPRGQATGKHDDYNSPSPKGGGGRGGDSPYKSNNAHADSPTRGSPPGYETPRQDSPKRDDGGYRNGRDEDGLRSPPRRHNDNNNEDYDRPENNNSRRNSARNRDEGRDPYKESEELPPITQWNQQPHTYGRQENYSDDWDPNRAP